MSRVGIALVAGVFLAASAPSDAETSARRTATAAKSGTTEKTGTAAKAKKRSKKKKAAKASKRKKSRIARKKAKRKSKDRRKGTRVAVTEKLPKNRGMPPGWAWPPDAPMKKASVACEETLDGLGITWERASAQGKMVDPIVVPSMEIGGIKYVSAYRRGPHRLDCQFVQTLATIGPELYALGVREIKFGSIYRNTKVRSHGTRKPLLSRHALGIAMDIKAITDETGRVAVVELDYLRGDPLLHAIEDTVNKSKKFRAVLTPGNDPISHDDHFHIEAFVDYSSFR